MPSDLGLDSPDDPADFIMAGRRAVMGEAVMSLADDPQKVGRAYELSRATGDKPALIYNDLDNYETQQKAALTSQLLSSNSFLRDYIAADTMHAKLSNDDYPALDEMTQHLDAFNKSRAGQVLGLPSRATTGMIGAAWEGFHEGIGEGRLGDWVNTVPQLKDQRFLQSIYATAGLPIEVPMRFLSGGIKAATEAAKAGAAEFYRTTTGDAQGAERFARDIAGMAEMQLTGMGVHKVSIDPAAIKKAHDALISTKLWLDHGVEPPAGLDPTIDKIKLDQNNSDIKQLDSMLRTAQSSATRERDPDTFARFIRMRDEGTIAIDGEAVGRLYGDKVPEVEDGILGWHEGLADQLATARATGADVEIPLADFLARMADTPDVYKALKDDIRVRPGGITKNEAKVAIEQKEAIKSAAIKVDDQIFEGILHSDAYEAASKSLGREIENTGEGGFVTSTGQYIGRKEALQIAQQRGQDSRIGDRSKFEEKDRELLAEDIKSPIEREVLAEDLPQLRASAGLEPLFSIGDRKIKIEKMGGKTHEAAGFGTFHDFHLLDENGQKVGALNLTEQEGGKQLYVDMIQGGPPGSKLYNPNSMGPALMRDLLRQIKEAFPNAESITGHRVSGAREKAESYMQASASPVIKLDAPDITNLRQLFTNAQFKPVSDVLEAAYKPSKLLTEHELELSQAIGDELARLIPKQADVSTPSAMRQTAGKREVYGAHISYTDRNPFVIVSLDGPHPVGTAQHEAIHHLRQQGFFTNGEWDVLARAARDNGWVEQYGIDRKYAKLDNAAKLEEAVAEGFRGWKEGKPTPQAAVTLFERLKELFENIKVRFKGLLGKDVTWEELFQKVDTGEVGQREGNAPLREEAYKESVDYFRRAANDNKQKLDKLKSEEVTPTDAQREWMRELASIDDQLTRLGRKYNYDESRFSEFELRLMNQLQSRWDKLYKDGHENFDPLLPKFSLGELPAEGTTRIEDRPLFRTPATIGMTEKQARLYSNAIRDMHESDIEWSKAVVEKEQRKRQTAEWKAERKIVHSEVEAEMNARPDVAADLFFGRGELYGEKLESKPKIAFESLTPEERAKLPEGYIAKEGVGGIDLDDAASLVGYPSGKAMIEHLTAYNEAKLAANMSAKAFRDRMVDLETERQMTGRHGDLEENILDAAKDQVTSETQLNLIAEEVLALGIRGKGEASINKLELKGWVQERFGESPMAGQSSDKFLKAAGKGGTAAEIALLQEKFDEAYRAKQQQFLAMMLAKEARGLEKEQKQFAKLATRLSKRDVKGLSQPFQDAIQGLMWQAELKPLRSILEIQRSQAIHGETLEGLVQSSKADGYSPDVGDDLIGGRAKALKDMTVNEFREFRNAIVSLNKIGREVEKIEIAGEKQDFRGFKEGIITNIMERPRIDRKTQENKLWKLYWGIDSSLTKPETLLKALDLGEEMGPLVDAIARPLAESKAKKYTMQEELAEKIRGLESSPEWRKSLKDDIPNNWFRDPNDGQMFKLSREDMIGIMLNRGNKSNVDKFNRSWGSPDPKRQATKAEAAAFEVKLKDWLDTHATRDDWKFAQGVLDIYMGYRAGMETVWSNTAGTQPRLIEPVPIDTSHGQFAGGYFPLLRDQFLSPRQIDTGKGLFEGDYPNYSTPQGHLVERTGAPYYVDFRQPLSMIPTRIQQVIHDIAYRAEVMNSAKILRDKEIQGAIRNHYGDMYVKQLDAMLEKTARGSTINEKDQSAIDGVLRTMRLNLIQYALPFNYVVTGTPDVGNFNLVAMHRYWSDKAGNNAIAKEWSKEIPHAIYNMDRDFAEAMQKAVGEGKMDEFKARTTRWGYKIVQGISQEFRTSVFIDRYSKALEEGKSQADAAAIADSVVREQFGSTAIHDLPSIMTTGEKGRMLTMFYGFFNGQYNRLRPMRDMMKREEYMQMTGNAIGTIVVGSIFGALIANSAREDESWAKRFIKSPFLYGASLFPFVREAGTLAFEGIPPRTPLGSVLGSASAVGHDTVNYMKGKPIDKGVQHVAAAGGLLFGLPGGLQLGRSGQGAYDWATGKQQPRTFMEYLRLGLTGEMRLKHSGGH